MSFVLSSVYSISTTKPFSSKDFFAVSTSFCNTDVTTTCFIPVPMLIYTFTVSPAFTSVPSSVSCFVIYPDSIVLLVSSTNSSFNLASFADFSASSFVVPTNFGTLVFSVPKLTITLISDFSFTVPFWVYFGFCEIIFPASTSALYSASPSEYTNLLSWTNFLASSTVFPTKLGIATSFVLVAFAIPKVVPKLNTNNNISPTIVDNTLCFFTNATNLFSFFFAVAFGPLLSSWIVDILCVGASTYSLLSTKFPCGSFNALFKSINIAVALW